MAASGRKALSRAPHRDILSLCPTPLPACLALNGSPDFLLFLLIFLFSSSSVSSFISVVSFLVCVLWVCMCKCFWRSEVKFKCQSSEVACPSSEAGSLAVLELTDSARLTDQRAPDPGTNLALLSPTPTAGSTSRHFQGWPFFFFFLTWMLGIDLRSSFLSNKYLTNFVLFFRGAGCHAAQARLTLGFFFNQFFWSLGDG